MIKRKYGVETRIYFPLITKGDADFLTSATIAAGDAQISKDGGDFANIVGESDNDFFTEEGNGIYSIKVAAAELSCACVIITVIDQTSPKEWEDQSICIETYGGVDAQYPLDLEPILSMQYVLDALLRTVLDSSTMAVTTVATLASQTSFTLTAGPVDDDACNGCVAILKSVSTPARKAIGIISDYVGSSKTVTLAKDPGVFTLNVGDEVIVITSAAFVVNLLRADKVIDIGETPWVVDYKEEGTEDVLMSKTMKNTAGNDIVDKDNVLGQLEQE